MPNQRRADEGTFAAHFDHLVRHFPHEPASKLPARNGSKPRKRKVKTPACVNRALLDEAAASPSLSRAPSKSSSRW
jgi:hypothetical protein